jgi:Txe/YoeB family toxin of Txe-Axe toxin-antitoxin module
MYQKLIYKFKYLKLELQDLKQKTDEYNLEFMEDFREELEFLDQKNNQNLDKIPDGTNQTTNQSPIGGEKETFKNLKEIYRSIVKKIHPDKHPSQEKGKYESLLKNLTEAYENNRLIEMLEISSEENIDLSGMIDDSEDFLIKNIEDIEKKLEKFKNQLCWIWVNKIKQESNSKKNLYGILGIDEEEFIKWKNNKS